MSADEVTGNGSSGIMNCVSLPRPFDEGNFGEWLLRFEICSSANNWNDEVKVRRLPTLLEGEAFLAYQRLPDDVRRNYGRLATELKNSLQPPGSARAAFVQFESMRWRTGESVRAFVHRLTQALDLAVPGLDTRSRDRLLLQRFLSALPELRRRQVLLQGEIDSVEQAIQKTQILLSFDEMPLMPAATVAVPANAPAQEKTVRDEDRWRTIDQRIDELSEQLSMLTMRPPEQLKGLECYACGRIGHFARNCRANRNERSLTHSVQNALSDRVRRSSGPTAHRVSRWRGPRRSTYRTEQVSATNSHFTSTIVDHSAKVNFQNNVCMIPAFINDYCCDVMIDTGSSVSLLSDRVVQALAKEDTVSGIPLIRLLNASSQPVTVKGEITLRVSVGKLAHPFKFIVVQNLVADAILGMDFLVKNGANVDLQKRCISSPYIGIVNFKQPALQLMSKSNLCYVHSHCALLPHYEDSESVENDDRMECEVPWFGNATKCELPVAPTIYDGLLGDFKSLFVAKPGKTNLAKHAIITEGNPVRVPPRRIPEQFRNTVRQQIEQMLNEGIIRRSQSPWLAPAVFTRKKDGSLRLCVDYRQLNKRTRKDSYPLPLPDEVQGKLKGATKFSVLDLHCGFWQLPVREEDVEKTAFSPGPGMGLYEFLTMPFGLTNGPSSFQRLMDVVLEGIDFTMVYMDDILVFSKDDNDHMKHLVVVFERIAAAGLTLRGRKCRIGVSEVSFLGHVFSSKGMQPDPSKVQCIVNWPKPTNVNEVQRFIGLASYYRRFIAHFADIAAPLHSLTQKDAPFVWSEKCQESFETLKEALSSEPILALPDCAVEFDLFTDASQHGLGAILEQRNHVIAYASRVLRPAERNYSVIEKECLAIVFAVKQFRHYLLGSRFTIHTDHRPLQWLQEQKMEGKIARWALALQEFDFSVSYCPAKENKADPISRQLETDVEKVQERRSKCTVTMVQSTITEDELRTAQLSDVILSKVIQELQNGTVPSTTQANEWKKTPLLRYAQIADSLSLCNGVLHRTIRLEPNEAAWKVPVIPESLKTHWLQLFHDSPAGAHLGADKTLDRLRKSAYWVRMAHDVNEYCKTCTKCQQHKLNPSPPVPLMNMPIGSVWHTVGIDVLQLPESKHGNKYLLVLQDYYSKWIEAQAMKDQKAETVVSKLIEIFSRFGFPKVVHSDQGPNFESTVTKDVLEAFGVKKTHTTSYHPQGNGLVERSNRTIIQMLRTYVDRHHDWEDGLPMLLYAYRTTRHASTGVSPYLLMFGREPDPLPIYNVQPEFHFLPRDYVSQCMERTARVTRFVDAHIAKAQSRQKEGYDALAKERDRLHPGDCVLLQIPKQSKLAPKWETGWKVEGNVGRTSVSIRHEDGRQRTVHINRLQTAYHNSPVPTIKWNPPSVIHQGETTMIPPEQTSTNQTEALLRRSSRHRSRPKWLDDFV